MLIVETIGRIRREHLTKVPLPSPHRNGSKGVGSRPQNLDIHPAILLGATSAAALGSLTIPISCHSRRSVTLNAAAGPG
jgi:hypothetical protein